MKIRNISQNSIQLKNEIQLNNYDCLIYSFKVTNDI